MKIVIGLLTIGFLAGGCASNDAWTKSDKTLFGTLCAAQVGDFITTKNYLDRNPNNYIDEPWCKKYGEKRPSSGELAMVKLIELGAAWFIADCLPQKYRKYFLIPTAALLTWCAIGNLE